MSEDPPSCLQRERAMPTACDTPRRAAIGKESLVMLAASELGDGVSVIDMNDAICGVDTCPTSIDGTYVWRDKHHLTASYARRLTDELYEKLQPALFKTAP